MDLLRGATSLIVPFRFVDTNGIPATGLVFNTSGLSCAYLRELDAAPTTISLLTMTLGTWVSGGFIQQSSSAMAGGYSLGVPNAAISASDASRWVEIQFTGTNVYAQPLRIDLVAYNPQNANLGLSNVAVNLAQVGGVNIPASSQSGVLVTDPHYWNGTAVSSPATPGIPDVNAKYINNVAASGVTAVNANIGTTQPINFTGTGASALAKADSVDWAGGAIPAPVVTGVPKIDLTYALGTLLTETVGGYLAAGFKKFFDVLNGTATLLNLPLNTDYTAARAAKLDNLDTTVSSRSTYAGADTSGTATLLTRIPGTVQPQTGDSFVRLGAPAGMSVSADIAEIEGETDAIQTSTAPLTFTTPNRVDASVPAASDPLAVPVPGSYASGTAGYDISLLPSIQASTAQIGAANLTFPSPAFNIPTRPIVAGRAYNSAYGNALPFTITNLLIDLTGPGVTCSLNIHVNGSNVPLAATADSATAGHVNIAAATTAAWGPPADQQALRYAAELVVYSGSVPIDVTHGFVYVAAGVNNS